MKVTHVLLIKRTYVGARSEVITRGIPGTRGAKKYAPTMPKRKRKAWKVARGLAGSVVKSSVAEVVEHGRDADSDGISEEDVDFIREELEEGRLAFLKDLVP